VPRDRHIHRVLPALAALLLVSTVAGCNALFVPRKETPSPSPSPNTVVHRYVELEARLPDEIAGQPVEKFSLTTEPDTQSAKTLEVLRRLGKTTADVQLARGFVNGVDVNLSALRIIGSDAIRAAVAFEQIDEGDPHSSTTYLPATIAGKRVLVRKTGETTDYMYPLGDTIFVVGGSRALVEEALTKIR
jgi:hypothetical protein